MLLQQGHATQAAAVAKFIDRHLAVRVRRQIVLLAQA